MKNTEIEIAWGFSVWPDKMACENLCCEETGVAPGQILCVGWRCTEQCMIRKPMEYASMGENTFFDRSFLFLLSKANFKTTTTKGHSTNCSFGIYFRMYLATD